MTEKGRENEGAHARATPRRQGLALRKPRAAARARGAAARRDAAREGGPRRTGTALRRRPSGRCDRCPWLRCRARREAQRQDGHVRQVVGSAAAETPPRLSYSAEVSCRAAARRGLGGAAQHRSFQAPHTPLVLQLVLVLLLVLLGIGSRVAEAVRV
eukprot:343245-Chlamydomonas_euryale.AAC.5